MNILFNQIINKKIIFNYLTKRYYSKAKSTIFSLSSGHGKCGVAIIRVSGPESFRVCQEIAGFKETNSIGNQQLIPRYAHLRKFRHPRTKELIDRGLLIWFPGPNSFTGEDSCEFQIHGGLAVIAAMLNALNSMNGLRSAKPGEFTKRAFYGGKLDLTEVEGLADLIHAETEFQRKQALLQANGEQSKLYNGWKTRLLKCIAHIEAYIDFAEDENIESDILLQLVQALNVLENDIEAYLNDGRRGERLRSGIKTIILGAPNVGKSSFMNVICSKSISIVTDIEGTTRDLIEQPFNISGYPVLFADTAGLRTTSNDRIELEGIERARNHTKLCDLIIIIIDAKSINSELSECNRVDFEKIKFNYIANQLGLNESIKNKTLLFIVNKSDLIEMKQLKILKEHNPDIVFISCKTNDGIAEVLSKLEEKLKELCGEPSTQCLTLSHERHRHLLMNCIEQLHEFHEYFHQNQGNQDFAIAAQKLRMALRSIGSIVGDVSTEEILDVIFKDFCIGK